VRIDGRSYVDGGICSPSNLDLLSQTDVDLAICFNPMSSLGLPPGGSAGERLTQVMRTQMGRRLGHEARKLRATGKRVVLLQPEPDESALMGANALSGRHRIAIADLARASVGAALRRLRQEGALLPGRPGPRGHADRRPAA
jgi:NTE family protein